MTKHNTYLGIIPARAGSKGVDQKNIRSLGGQPLIAHTIKAANAANELDRAIVTTDDTQIQQVAREHGGEAPFRRPSELATDEAAMAPVVEHALTYLEDEENYSFSGVVLLQPTSPLRTTSHIDCAIRQHRESDVTTVVSVYEDHSYRWRPQERGARQLNYTGSTHRRQDKTPEYVENGAIYIVNREHFVEHGELRGGTVGLFEMDERESIDIDTEFDLWLAEQIHEYSDESQ